MPTLSLKTSSKGVTALIVTAAVVFFGCALIFVAAEGKIKAQEAKRTDMEKQVADSRQIAQKLEQTKLTYADTCSQIRFLESSVSTQSYVPTLLQQLERLGHSVNLKVLGVRPQPQEAASTARSASGGAKAEGASEAASGAKSGDAATARKAPGPYDELKIDVEAEGNFSSALDFLYRLTSFPKIIAVNSVEMAPVSTEKTAGSPRLTIKLNITAFVLKDAAPHAEPMRAEGRPANESG